MEKTAGRSSSCSSADVTAMKGYRNSRLVEFFRDNKSE